MKLNIHYGVKRDGGKIKLNASYIFEYIMIMVLCNYVNADYITLFIIIFNNSTETAINSKIQTN